MADPLAIPKIVGASALGGAAVAYGTTGEIVYEAGLAAESTIPGITQAISDFWDGFGPIPTLYPGTTAAVLGSWLGNAQVGNTQVRNGHK
jgi:hypothetical protein